MNNLEGFDVTHYDPAIARRAAVPNSVTLCKLCTKPYMVAFYAGDVDLVCGECYEVFKDCARIACSNCKEVVARVSPGLIECGYVVLPGSLLHTDRCNMCYQGDADKWTSEILEVAEWMRKSRKSKIISII